MEVRGAMADKIVLVINSLTLLVWLITLGMILRRRNSKGGMRDEKDQ
mgnify:CR=1 FL=1